MANKFMVRVMVPELPRNGSLPEIFKAMATGECEVEIFSTTYETETLEQAAERAANYVELEMLDVPHLRYEVQGKDVTHV